MRCFARGDSPLPRASEFEAETQTCIVNTAQNAPETPFQRENSNSFGEEETHGRNPFLDSGGIAIRYVLPVLWMMSCFHFGAVVMQSYAECESPVTVEQHEFDTATNSEIQHMLGDSPMT